MFYVLLELDHGDALGEFDSLEQAEAALDRVLVGDPTAAGDLAIVAYDEAGQQQGEPITRAAA
jgi:hypothetical protein